MGKARFHIRCLSRLSGGVKTDVPILGEDPTTDHPVLACPTGRSLCLVFEYHHAGGKNPLTFIHIFPRPLPLNDMRVSIDHGHGFIPSFAMINLQTTVLGDGEGCCQGATVALDAPVVPDHDLY
jgi:hypothetical protein